MIAIKIINREKCPGEECKKCIEACPENVLALQNNIVEVVNLKKCIDCDVCQEICPEKLFIFEKD